MNDTTRRYPRTLQEAFPADRQWAYAVERTSRRMDDVGTYHYGDNLARGVRHVARQLVDLIPKIYDTQRIARIIGEDGETKMIKINPEQPQPVNKIVDQQGIVIEKIYNPGVGKYDVVAITGPGYATNLLTSRVEGATINAG